MYSRPLRYVTLVVHAYVAIKGGGGGGAGKHRAVLVYGVVCIRPKQQILRFVIYAIVLLLYLYLLDVFVPL